MITPKALPRRTFLRGAGAAVALPFLDAMAPAFASSRLPGKTPVRMAFVYVPNGIDMRHWTPEQDGPLGTLPRILEPLEPLKKDLLVLSNLTHNNGRALLDGRQLWGGGLPVDGLSLPRSFRAALVAVGLLRLHGYRRAKTRSSV